MLKVMLATVGRWATVFHRPAFEDAHHVPTDRPFLLVANHSGGLALSEIGCFVKLYIEQFGVETPLAGMAHPFGFVLWPYKIFINGLGAIPSTYAAAVGALEAGVPVLVFPGGDYEAARPVWQAGVVDFNNRRGFLKIARQANVPIVPLGIRGSHISVPILWRSRHLLPKLLVLPTLLGLKRFPLTFVGLAGLLAMGATLPVHVGWAGTAAVMWAWMCSPFPLLPIVPSSIRLRFGAPIEPEVLFEAGDASLDKAYETVIGTIQGLVDAER